MIYKFLFILVLISQVTYGQTSETKTNQAFLFIDSFFTKEIHTAEIIELKYPKDIEEILLRVQQSIAGQKEWFEQYFSENYKAGEGLPYHVNFAVEEEEYLKIQNIQNNPPQRVVRDSTFFKVLRNNNIISFKAIDKRAKVFESIQFDINNGILKFINDTISFFNDSNSLAQSNSFTWKKVTGNLGEKDVFKVDSLISKVIEISFETLPKESKVFFHIIYKEVDKGIVKANFDMMCYLN